MAYLDPSIESAIMNLSGQSAPQQAPVNNNALELLAMAADKLGSGIDPKNPAAGFATAIAQSRIANRAKQQEGQQQKNMIEAVLKALGGFTDKGMPGATSLTTTTDADGNPEHTIKFNTEGFINAGINPLSTPIQQAAPVTTEQKQNVFSQTPRSNLNLFPFF